MKTKDPINQSAKSVFHKFKPSQFLHFKYSVLRLSNSVKKPHKAQSQFSINSNLRDVSIWNILCCVSHIHIFTNLERKKFSQSTSISFKIFRLQLQNSRIHKNIIDFQKFSPVILVIRNTFSYENQLARTKKLCFGVAIRVKSLNNFFVLAISKLFYNLKVYFILSRCGMSWQWSGYI